jgi:hypothetical protein
MRPPEYGSPEWKALPRDHPQRREAVVFAADAWRLLNVSPHIADLLLEFTEWLRRKSAREASWAISAAADWRALSGVPSFAELELRRSVFVGRALSPREIRTRAAESWAAVEADLAKGQAA